MNDTKVLRDYFEKDFRIKRNGRVFCTDPDYDKSVSCRYESKKLNFVNWTASMYLAETTNHYNEDGYEFDFNDVEFKVLLLSDKAKNDFKLTNKGKCLTSGAYTVEPHEVGCDTARLEYGIANDKDELYAYSTGADGHYGTTFEIRDFKTNEVQGIYIQSGIDPDFMSLEEMKSYLKDSFGLVK